MGNCIKLGSGPVFKPTGSMYFKWYLGTMPIGWANLTGVLPVWRKVTLSNFVIDSLYSLCSFPENTQATDIKSHSEHAYNASTGQLKFYEVFHKYWQWDNHGAWTPAETDRYIQYNMSCIYPLSQYLEEYK